MDDYKTQFDAVKIGDDIYTIIEKDKFKVEELEKVWLIKRLEEPTS